MSDYGKERRRAVDQSYRRRYTWLRYNGVDTAPVDSAPVAAHIRALNDLGWSLEAITHMAVNGISDSTVAIIANGSTGSTHIGTARAILGIPYTLAPTPAVPDTCLIPTLGAQRRVRALMRLGWTHDAMREVCGLDTSHMARGTYHQTLARKVRAISAMYDQLSMAPGKSVKTTTYARNHLYHPPLAWWDIDDPAETPSVGGRSSGEVIDRTVVARLLAGERVPSTRAEKVEAMRRWLADGNSERSLCVMHGWNDNRYGRAAS